MITRHNRTFSIALVASAATLTGATLARRPFSRAQIAPPLTAPALTAPALTAPSSTRDLFRYRRDDSAPGQLTSIHINAAQGAAAPINQNVFGNFLEHLGGTIYEGVWAQVLLNPNLERIEERETMPPAWDFKGNAAWQDGGYLSPRCVRLNGAQGSLSQRIFLPVHRTRGYVLTLFTRASGDAGQVDLTLRTGEDGAGPIVQSASLPVQGATWQKRVFRWNLPVASLQKGQGSRLFLVAANGAVDVDQIEIMPDDAVNGLDPDVLRLARAWRIPILRYSGNFSSGYHWRNGVGLHVARPTLRNPAWGGIETNHFGTDEFLDFARRLNAVPQIGANAGSGTPEEAAAWVRYCNERQLRVPLWEIGNELYGGWQIGHTDAAGNAERFVRFRRAMMEADPRIQIIATGKGDEFQPDGMRRNADWNEAVLRAALAGNGRAPEFLSIHPLVGLPGDLGNRPYAEQYESALAHPAFMDQSLLPALADTIRRVEGPNAPTRIAPTEWGIIIVGGGRWREGPNHDAVSGAIYNALALNTFLRHSDWVTLANMTALTHGGGIKKPRGVAIVDPQYYTQQLYAAAAPRVPLQTTWSGPGRDVPSRGFLPAVPDVPDVDVFSALNADRSRLNAFVVNRSLDAARPVRLTMDSFAPRRVSATILTATDVNIGNTWDHPDNVAPRPFSVPPGSARNGWTLTVPPHALVVLTFERAAAKSRR